MAKLEERITRWAAREPRPGEGLHVDIFRAAIILLEDGYAEGDVFTFLRRAANMVTDRHVPDREITGAINSAKARISGDFIDTPRWPEFAPQLRAEIVANAGVTLPQLDAACALLPQDPWFYLERIFAPFEFVCLGYSSHEFTTKMRDQLQPILAVRKVEYINPNPMTDEFGLTKDGKVSAHCLDNTGDRVFQVVEFDTGRADEHAALLWYLARSMPLVLMVYSGGKSLHGWFNVRGRSETEVFQFFSSAVQLGADPKMRSKCQFSRLPGGWNNRHQKQQSVVLFEPSHLS